jgi:hypothetical protein
VLEITQKGGENASLKKLIKIFKKTIAKKRKL